MDDIREMKSALRDVVARLEQRFPYASISVAREQSTAIQMDRHQATVINPPSETGTIVTVFDGQGMAEEAVNLTDIDGINAAVNRLMDRVVYSPFLSPPEPGAPWAGDFYGPCGRDPASVPLEEKINGCRDARDRLLDGAPQVRNARISYEERKLTKVFVNSTKSLSQELSFVSASMTVYSSDGTNTQRAHDGNTAAGGYELFARFTAPELLDELVRSAVGLLRAEKVDPGWHEVVTMPSISGTVAHEAFGHGVELDMEMKQCAQVRSYLGKQVASPLVNMFDSPSNLDSAGFYFFDDEGEQARPTQIIRDGILVSGISDLYSARQLQQPRTPHGRRESFRRRIYSRMANTYIAPRDTPWAELIRRVHNGVLLRHGGRGMEDPLGWGMQIDVHGGEEIRNGQLTGKLYSPVSVTGFVPDLLKSITGISREFGTYGLGRCGKTFTKDWISVGFGGPYLLFTARLA